MALLRNRSRPGTRTGGGLGPLELLDIGSSLRNVRSAHARTDDPACSACRWARRVHTSDRSRRVANCSPAHFDDVLLRFLCHSAWREEAVEFCPRSPVVGYLHAFPGRVRLARAALHWDAALEPLRPCME